MSGETLILSLDYELFFGTSGSAEKCLFEPSAALMQFCNRHNVQVTFFVDVGMIIWLRRNMGASREFRQIEKKICLDIENFAKAGSEIALHVHPHWEDAGWSGTEIDFRDTRFRLAEFTDSEVEHIFERYASVLAELSESRPTAYRAGGFCVMPFARIRKALQNQCIWVDSSIVPGASLIDKGKGFDFRSAPKLSAWKFDRSPLQPNKDGKFVEVPVGTFQTPLAYFWRRGLERLLNRRRVPIYGDGSSMALGRTEIIRRLLARSRVSELSIDEPKLEFLEEFGRNAPSRNVWSVMGHPKLMSRRSLDVLEKFIGLRSISEFQSVSCYANRIRSGRRAE